MKILHTSDWHLGMKLNDIDRLPECEYALEYLTKFAEKEQVDMVVIAGDIYDSFIPSSDAENLFFETVKKFSRNGKCAVVVISGNHDEPKRLMTANVFAKEFNIFIVGDMNPVSLTKKKFENINATESGSGYIKFKTSKNENVVVACLPYPSYYRYKEMRKDGVTFQEDVKKWFTPAQEQFNSDSINIVVSHLFTYPHEPSDEDRAEVNQISSAYPFVDRRVFSEHSTYTALGHIHKYMQVSKRRNVYYCGSLIHKYPQETSDSPSAILVELEPSSIKSFTPIVIPNLKTIEEIEVKNLEDIEEIAKNKPNSYLQFCVTNFSLSQIDYEIELRKKYKNITAIKIKRQARVSGEREVFVKGNLTDKQILEKFAKTVYGETLKPETVNLFLELMAEVQNETL